MNDDCDRFDIVPACHLHRTEEVGKNVSARSLFSCGPDIAAALHFTYDDCAPSLFRTDFIISVFLNFWPDKFRTQIANGRVVIARRAGPWFVSCTPGGSQILPKAPCGAQTE
jgi:hypothetical protein